VLPTDQINDVFVAKNGTIYVATTLGLSWSTDHGASWQFVRGADWVDKVKGRLGGAPVGWQPPIGQNAGGAILSEDYVSTLAEDGQHRILVGHRQTVADVLEWDSQNKQFQKSDAGVNQYVTSLVILPESRNVYQGTYGHGLLYSDSDKSPNIKPVADAPGSKTPMNLPAAARVPTAEVLQKLIDSVKARGLLESNVVPVAYLGEDWKTQGDWVGRYGRQHNILCASMSPYDQQLIWDNLYHFSREIGPNHPNQQEALRGWLASVDTPDVRSLYNPIEGTRRQHIWDDHGESYPTALDGPDIRVTLSVPKGTHRVSCYLCPFQGHEHAISKEFRDLIVDVSKESVGGKTSQPLARARVEHFYGGVYKQFVVQGPGTFRFEFHKNYSYNTVISGIFVDRLIGESTRFDALPLAWLGGISYDPPIIEEIPHEGLASDALTLWSLASDSLPKRDDSYFTFGRILALRTAISAQAPRSLIKNWRWKACLWTKADRREFRKTMDEGWDAAIKMSPEMVWQTRKPLSDLDIP
jgi:hypothetical protein